jgi:hypothetical protein
LPPRGYKYSEKQRKKLIEVHIGIQAGDKNPAWKGDKAKPERIRLRMRKIIPEPADGQCPMCGKIAKRLSLLNVTKICNSDSKNWQWRCSYKCNQYTTGYRFAGTLSDHLCSWCGKPTKYSTRPPYGPNPFHPGCYAKWKNGVDRSVDANNLIRCPCPRCKDNENAVFTLRKLEPDGDYGRKRQYLPHHQSNGIRKAITEKNVIGYLLRQKIRRIRDVKNCEFINVLDKGRTIIRCTYPPAALAITGSGWEKCDGTGTSFLCYGHYWTIAQGSYRHIR